MLPQWPAGAPGLMGVMGYPGAGAYGAPGPGPQGQGPGISWGQGPGAGARAYGLPGAANV